MWETEARAGPAEGAADEAQRTQKMVLKQGCHSDTSPWTSFSSFSWLAFFLLFYRQKEVAQEENNMGYYHFYRIFENKIMMIN